MANEQLNADDDQIPLTPVPTPRFQPGSVRADGSVFERTSIPWWNNGIWGEAGYAIPNDGGKPASGNGTLRGLVAFMGRELQNLMHKPDVKFTRPFNAEWLFNLNKALALGIKRMNDYSVGWTDDRQGDADHNINTPQDFILFPVPLFGERIRQMDARRWCAWILEAIGELMQHSDNDFDDDLTDFVASKVQQDLRRIQKDMAMKYLGKSREEVDADGWPGPVPSDFDATNYDPAALFTESEMMEERMPLRWWPSGDDLTAIRGIPCSVARQWAAVWPSAGLAGDGGAHEAAFPGDGTGSNVITPPSKGAAQLGQMVNDPSK